MADPNIASRVDELRVIQGKIIEKKFGMSREEMIAFLVDAVKTPVGEANETHHLCQEYTETTGPNGTSHKYKMVTKLDAAEKLIKMAGWYAPEKIEHSGGIAGMFAELTGVKK